MSEIRPHTCTSKFQDETYGRGLRVWNRTDKGLRCTVCSGETTDNTVAKPVKDKK